MGHVTVMSTVTILRIASVFILLKFCACNEPGDSFTDFPSKYIHGFNDRTLTSVSLDTCLNGCLHETGFCCRSVDFYTGSSNCYLSQAWSGTQAVVPKDGADHYQRINNDCENQCVINPCQNEGDCSPTGFNQYTCTCAGGFIGENCEQDADECASNPCQNGGTCGDEVNQYTCTCAAGFSGVNCDEDVDECASNPCQNGGSCSDEANQYTCTCATGFTGEDCEACSPSNKLSLNIKHMVPFAWKIKGEDYAEVKAESGANIECGGKNEGNLRLYVNVNDCSEPILEECDLISDSGSLCRFNCRCAERGSCSHLYITEPRSKNA